MPRAGFPFALFLIVLLGIVPAAEAQIPQTISYQGFLTDELGEPIDDEQLDLTFRIYDTATDGRLRWLEEHTGVAVNDGVFSVYLGESASLGTVSFDVPLWLSVAIGDATAEELSPRTALAAVPYALHSASAETITDLPDGSVSSEHLASGAVTADAIKDGSVASDELQDGAVTTAKIDSETSTAGEALVSDGSGGAYWNSIAGAWTVNADALVTDRKVGIGLPYPTGVGNSGLEVAGRIRARQNADLNRANFLVRPTYSVQDESGDIYVGMVGDTTSTTLIGGMWMEANPDGDVMRGTMHLVTGTMLANGGVAWGRRITILNDGKVGIGETAPTEQLHVDGNVEADQFLTASDARLKNHVEDLSGAMDIVESLRGVTYEWKDPAREGRQVGFIAQEVASVLPEVVSTDSEGIHKVAYSQVVPILVEAIKQQQRQLDELEREVRALRAQRAVRLTSEGSGR